MDREGNDYPTEVAEMIKEREIPNFPEKEATSKKEELKLHLAQLEASLENERSDAKIGIAGAEKRTKRLEMMIESLKKRIAEINE